MVLDLILNLKGMNKPTLRIVESSFRKSGYDNPGLNPGEWIKAPPFMAPVGSGWLMSEVTLTVLMNIPFQWLDRR